MIDRQTAGQTDIYLILILSLFDEIFANFEFWFHERFHEDLGIDA